MTARTAAWHAATVVASRPETATARRIELEVPTWPGNEAGSHLDVRLTAPDGYQASRSYSIASAGPGTRIVLAVDEVPDGEVSPFLVHDLRDGDQIEVHGPLGAFFVWMPSDDPAPVQLIAGGSGVVPLFAMASAHAASADATPFGCSTPFAPPTTCSSLTSSRRWSANGSPSTSSTPAGPRERGVCPRTTDRRGPACRGHPGRPAAARLRLRTDPFVEAVSGWLIEAGHSAARIRTERFGGS